MSCKWTHAAVVFVAPMVWLMAGSALAETASAPTLDTEPTKQAESTLDGVAAREKLPLGPRPADGSTSSPENSRTGHGPWMLHTLSALGVVIVLIFMVRLLLRRMGGQAQTPDRSGLVEVLGRTTIAPKTAVLFLKVHQRVIVVSQSPTGMSTLASFDQPEEVAALLQQIESSRPSSVSGSFRQLLRRLDGDYQRRASLREEGGDSEEQYIDRTREQVSGLLSRIRSNRPDEKA